MLNYPQHAFNLAIIYFNCNLNYSATMVFLKVAISFQMAAAWPTRRPFGNEFL